MDNTTKKIGISLEYANGLTKHVEGNSINELIQGLEELNDERFVNAFISKFPDITGKQLEKLDNMMLKSKNAAEICKYVKQRKKISNLEKFVNKLIILDAVYQLIELAIHVKGVDIEKIEDAIIESKNTKAMVTFYEKTNRAAYSKKIQEALFNANAAQDIYDFFYVRKNRTEIINMNEMIEAERIIISSGDTRIMRLWAMNIRSSKKMEDVIIASKNPEAIFEYAEFVNGSDKYKLRRAIMATNNKFWIKQWKARFGIQGLFF